MEIAVTRRGFGRTRRAGGYAMRKELETCTSCGDSMAEDSRHSTKQKAKLQYLRGLAGQTFFTRDARLPSALT